MQVPRSPGLIKLMKYDSRTVKHLQCILWVCIGFFFKSNIKILHLLLYLSAAWCFKYSDSFIIEKMSLRHYEKFRRY